MSIKDISLLRDMFHTQKQHYDPSSPNTYKRRVDLLDALDELIRENIEIITSTIQEDFGSRGDDLIFTADIFPILDHIKHVKNKLKRWMKPEIKSSGFFALLGQKTFIHYEPLGVVGVMSPFNAPVSLAFNPAIDAIAAGNSVIIKISESTPKTATLIQNLVNQRFESKDIAVCCGSTDVSKVFSQLPWDSLLFTGGTNVGKKIMSAAGKNLTPVILELGGKCPCVVLPDADITLVAKKIAQVRQFNAGQVCLAGDFVFVHESCLEQFIVEAIQKDKEVFPTIVDNKDSVSIINQLNFDRITSWIEEARQSGCRIIESFRENETLPNKETRKVPLTLVINPDDNLKISQNEIFGPVLSIFTYKDVEEAISYINKKPKALALYVFGEKKTELNKIVFGTSSGGVTVNDMLMHAGSHTMGFGGVGESGIGRYKGGKEGFKSFSNPKSVFVQGMLKKYTGDFLPPYKKKSTRKTIRSMVGVKG